MPNSDMRISPSGPEVGPVMTSDDGATVRRASQIDFPYVGPRVLSGAGASDDLDCLFYFQLPSDPPCDPDLLTYRLAANLRTDETGANAESEIHYSFQVATGAGIWTTIYAGNIEPVISQPQNEGHPVAHWILDCTLFRFWDRNVTPAVRAAWTPGAQVGARILFQALNPAQTVSFGATGSHAELIEVYGSLPMLT